MNKKIEEIKTAIEPLRQQIIHHKIYAAIKDIEDLKIFMQYHIFAVWDFMSLLKSLQNNLTCTTIPWFPKGQADTRYLINEIIVGEESDVDSNGIRKSHFEIYLDAMQQCGADTVAFQKFIAALEKTNNFNAAYIVSNTPKEARDFVDYTFKIIGSNKTYLQSAIFTFGREDLIPSMFVSIVNDIHKNFQESISILKYYLERHIEVDGGQHSHLALQMTANLCGVNNEFWQEAQQATIESLQKRINLWDGAYRQIMNKTTIATI
jgi:hypothetical protein